MNINNQTDPNYDDRLTALHSNMNAIRAVASAVEGTLGPKGLDTMLVDDNGQIIVTNDGVTILKKMEANHPAAKMLIQVAQSQQHVVGDGTTTATLLASELLTEAVNQVNKGVPIPKVIVGIKQGIRQSIELIQSNIRVIQDLSGPLLHQIALIAGREHEDIAELIIGAARLITKEKLLEPEYKFADSIIAYEGTRNELISGLILNKKRMNPQMPMKIKKAKILVIQDAFEPEDIDEEALGTEVGFSKYLEYKTSFQQNLLKLTSLGVNVIAVDRGVDPLAEEFCIDHGMMIIQRLSSQELKRLSGHTGARMIKRMGLHKVIDELQAYIGYADEVMEDQVLQKTRVIGGNGNPMASILVGASTGEIVEEKERIAKDAASSVQAAIIGGYVPGGGAFEFWIAKEVEKQREQMRGLEGFGLQAVVTALRKPMAQIIQNAGFNPLEKLEEVKVAQNELMKDSLGIHADTGEVMDMEQLGIIDPALVKIYALQAAGEISEAILRIQTILRMKAVD
ncbi:TCP-1/cpn60 chaperonin family protein [Tepidibacillus marianensis]|uniref:TCP-1/cpn60 chaperonin family protein n=1 Tax=Tepidibacillus marianensis TaxID=3131995 RepID=UPI0030CF1515